MGYFDMPRLGSSVGAVLPTSSLFTAFCVCISDVGKIAVCDQNPDVSTNDAGLGALAPVQPNEVVISRAKSDQVRAVAKQRVSLIRFRL